MGGFNFRLEVSDPDLSIVQEVSTLDFSVFAGRFSFQVSDHARRFRFHLSHKVSDFILLRGFIFRVV